ncbi:flagellar brake domain-containing protein [Alkalihalophilus lindianensis]|uniref:Flagellar brake domain-containing protein n=1 Tax=Alkalihalophilus lindianensis TaxID=1630542 RepID=A0ABU3X6D7_9BACI|nr:flagellar brake domain-containing protein [Alkalihalophilus lindianensis]MDV2683442.1 flagellar brake domain-containing protein [Alkalihalophilus lindianensis]
MIAIGTTMQIEMEDHTDEKKTKKLRCRLVDKSKGYLVIDYPINVETEKPSFILDGTKLKASFISESSTVYEFQTEVMGREKRNIPVLLLKDPGKEKYYRIQRRNYVRVEATTDVAVHPVGDRLPAFTTVSVDISGGGCAILIPKGTVLPIQAEVDITMVLPMQKTEQKFVRARCKVIRTYQSRPEAKMRASLQFIDLDQKDQDQIVRYCFERQVILRRQKRD